jgi:hypothetical protein
MLTPVLVRANYKVSSSQLVTIENLLGSNLPLLFPEVLVANRTPTSCAVTVSGQRRLVYVGSADPDFDGVLMMSPFLTFSVSDGQVAKLMGLDYSLTPSGYGQTTEIVLTNSGPAAQAWVSLIIKGMIESAVSPDPLVNINV